MRQEPAEEGEEEAGVEGEEFIAGGDQSRQEQQGVDPPEGFRPSSVE